MLLNSMGYSSPVTPGSVELPVATFQGCSSCRYHGVIAGSGITALRALARMDGHGDKLAALE
jgi:hypothetical protein